MIKPRSAPEREHEAQQQPPCGAHRERNCLVIALVFFVIAFAPITAAEHGFNPFPDWLVAWCLIGLPLGLIALIAAMPDGVDER